MAFVGDRGGACSAEVDGNVVPEPVGHAGAEFWKVALGNKRDGPWPVRRDVQQCGVVPGAVEQHGAAVGARGVDEVLRSVALPVSCGDLEVVATPVGDGGDG